jgi:hypothetical protein
MATLTPSHAAWSGLAFEKTCLLHLPQIKQKLGISGVMTEAYGWKSSESDPGAQVDLVIDRADRIINLCEAKYSTGEYAIDKRSDLSLRDKRAAFMAETGTRKGVQTTIISPFGLKNNSYSGSYPSQVTADDLFG